MVRRAVQAEHERLTKELAVANEGRTRNYNAGLKLKRAQEQSKAQIDALKQELADAEAAKQSLETAGSELQKRVTELETTAAAAGANEAQRHRNNALAFKKKADAAEKVRGLVGCSEVRGCGLLFYRFQCMLYSGHKKKECP